MDMIIFIHTFSLSVNITYEELGKLKCYRWLPLTNTYEGTKYISNIIEFCNNGLQMLIKKREEVEKTFDKKHLPYRMDLVVTPYKLLHSGASLGSITDYDELGEALKILDGLINNIETCTGIVIKGKCKIRRVDITCDVVTPSDEYSREIIAVTKTADLPYGYKKSEPTEEEIERYGWKTENGSLFYNKNQAVYAKIYNKKENIREKSEYHCFKNCGLIRYEIELTRKFLKREGLLEDNNLGRCLTKIMYCGRDLFERYFIDNLYDMPMFSLKVLEDYLNLKFAGKEKTLYKLKKFCREAYKCKRTGLSFTANQCGMSWKEFNNCYKKFEYIGISPIPAENDCPYIPSIRKMLDGGVENKLLYFAGVHTRGKELWYV